jgi:sulfopyruvate decarboxylase alpha subunit
MGDIPDFLYGLSQLRAKQTAASIRAPPRMLRSRRFDNWKAEAKRDGLLCQKDEDTVDVITSGRLADPIPDWPLDVFNTLKGFGVTQISYVPDAGHSRLINLAHADKDIRTTVLTTEEEGIALSAGAWIGGDRSAVLMQSSGVGNCVNMLSLMNSCRMPLLVLVTMRGEWAEFNPWQIPMGSATPGAFELMGVTVLRIQSPDEAAEVVAAGASLAFDGDRQVAVLISQRMLGKKKWVEQR